MAIAKQVMIVLILYGLVITSKQDHTRCKDYDCKRILNSVQTDVMENISNPNVLEATTLVNNNLLALLQPSGKDIKEEYQKTQRYIPFSVTGFKEFKNNSSYRRTWHDDNRLEYPVSKYPASADEDLNQDNNLSFSSISKASDAYLKGNTYAGSEYGDLVEKFIKCMCNEIKPNQVNLVLKTSGYKNKLKLRQNDTRIKLGPFKFGYYNIDLGIKTTLPTTSTPNTNISPKGSNEKEERTRTDYHHHSTTKLTQTAKPSQIPTTFHTFSPSKPHFTRNSFSNTNAKKIFMAHQKAEPCLTINPYSITKGHLNNRERLAANLSLISKSIITTKPHLFGKPNLTSKFQLIKKPDLRAESETIVNFGLSAMSHTTVSQHSRGEPSMIANQHINAMPYMLAYHYLNTKSSITDNKHLDVKPYMITDQNSSTKLHMAVTQHLNTKLQLNTKPHSSIGISSTAKPVLRARSLLKPKARPPSNFHQTSVQSTSAEFHPNFRSSPTTQSNQTAKLNTNTKAHQSLKPSVITKSQPNFKSGQTRKSQTLIMLQPPAKRSLISRSPSTPKSPTAYPLPECCDRKYLPCDEICHDAPCSQSMFGQHMAVCEDEIYNMVNKSDIYGIPDLLCAQVKPCVLDVSHRVHSCIDKYLYGRPPEYNISVPWPWTERHSITVCMDFPDEIWNIKPFNDIAWKITLIVLISLMGIIMNATVLYLLAKHENLQTPMNVFIGNLALADLLLAAVGPVLFLVEDFIQQYRLGHYGCKLQGFVQALLLTVSILNVVSVCATRLMIVTGGRLSEVLTPQKLRQRIRQALAVCMVTWLMAMTVASPIPYNRYFVVRDRKWIDYEETFCGENIWMTEKYWPSLVVIIIWLPLLFLIVSYLVIFIKLDRYERKKSTGQSKSARRRRHLLAMTFSLVIVFTICYTPSSLFIISRVTVVRNFDPDQHAFNILWWLSHWLTYLNCVINPIIYGHANDAFRKAFLSLRYVRRFHKIDSVDDVVTSGPKLNSATVSSLATLHERIPPLLHHNQLTMEALKSIGANNTNQAS